MVPVYKRFIKNKRFSKNPFIFSTFLKLSNTFGGAFHLKKERKKNLCCIQVLRLICLSIKLTTIIDNLSLVVYATIEHHVLDTFVG